MATRYRLSLLTIRALARIRQLYAIERRAKEFTSTERQRVRQTESLPLLESFGQWLEERSQRVLPKSPNDEVLPDVWFADHPEARRKRAA